MSHSYRILRGRAIFRRINRELWADCKMWRFWWDLFCFLQPYLFVASLFFAAGGVYGVSWASGYVSAHLTCVVR